MSKNIAISGYYGFENFGDEAILKTLTTELKNRGYNITVFSKNPQLTSSKLGVFSVNSFSLKKIIQTLNNCDVLISGGGSLLQDVTSLKSLFYYLFVIATALFFRKKVIIFAQGIGPINNIFGRYFTRLLLKHCRYISVRDEKSLFLLRSWGLNPDLVSDPVWSIPVKQKSSKNKIGIQLRSWANLSTQYLKNLAIQIIKEFPEKEICIYSFQDKLDFEVCKNFELQLKLINPNIKTQVLKAMSIDETINAFSELDYLIAMRFHACLLALKYGTPTLALSYDEKVEKLAKQFNLPLSLIDEKEDIEKMFSELKLLNSSTLLEKAETCKFNFENTIKAIEQ